MQLSLSEKKNPIWFDDDIIEIVMNNYIRIIYILKFLSQSVYHLYPFFLLSKF